VSRRGPAIFDIERSRWRGHAAVLACLWLAACGSTGDFGRERPSPYSFADTRHDWLGPAVASKVSDPPWQHQLTDEERRLRDLAYPLIEPPYDRHRWYSVLAERGLWSRPTPYPDRSAYASKLFTTAYRSQTARYSKLIEDIRNDITRLDPFFSVARHVADMDRRREQSLAYVRNLSREERDNTINRMRENEGVIRWVQGSLSERAASYRLALERMVIAAPSQMAVEAERTLALMQQRIAAYGA
jgi:hypothetical protein